MTTSDQFDQGTSTGSVDPIPGVPPVPDPPIAPGVDPDNPMPTDASPDRWLRYDGDTAQAVAHVGEWHPGEVKHIPGWLADRLLARSDFTEVSAPDLMTSPVAAEPARASRRARGDAGAAATSAPAPDRETGAGN